MTNRQVNGSQNFTPQASFIVAPQQQQMLISNLKQQPLIAAINPQIPQVQPLYIIAGGPNMPIMNPFMYQYNSMVPFSNPPMNLMYYPQTYRQNPISSRQIPISNSQPPESLQRAEKIKAEKPPVQQRQKSKEITMLYRYQKPVTVDELKHPSDKYKDLIYRPRFLTSKNIDPPTEDLVPKLDESVMTPLVDIKSRLNLTPSTSRPVLVEDLKLPVEKVESAKASVNKLPTLVEDLKLPNEKPPEPEIKKVEFKSEQIQVPDPDLFKFIEPNTISLNYIGKFHYPPEVDYNDVNELKNEFTLEKLEKLGEYRPKSVLVKVSFEKDSFELAKILFNPNVIIEYNQLIEAQTLDKYSTDRPKSSKLKEKEEKSPRLNKALKNVQEINESFKMEQSSLNENLRVPSSQSLKVVEHDNKNIAHKRALSNAIEINETIHGQEVKIDNNLKIEESEKADERIHSGNLSKNLTEKAFYASHQVMENITSEDLLEQDSNRPKSEKVEVQLENESFQDQSQEKFVNDIPIRDDIEGDDAADEVNIEQFETEIKHQTDKKHREHHFHFHGGNRICCSAHRRHDPYYNIESKVKSFENFGYQPQHNNFQIFSDRTYSRKNKPGLKSRKILIQTKPNQMVLPTYRDKKSQLFEYDGYRNVIKLPDGSIRVFSENLQWNHISKVGRISFENFNYKNEHNQVEVFSEKLKWNKESKIKALSELDLSQLNTHRSSQLFVFHELPKWNELVDSKVKSFENFHYKPSESSLKIYNEKIRWNSESRLKSYLNTSHEYASQTKLDSNREIFYPINRPDWFPGGKEETFNVYYKKWPSESRDQEATFRPVINENPKWNVESRIKAISWENIKYKPKVNRKKKEKFKSIPEKNNVNLNRTRTIKNTIKQKDVSQIWNQEYNRIKQENKKKRNLQLKNIKTPRRINMDTPEVTKISSRQSMSKYKELPPIKSGKENNFYKQSNLENTAFQRDDTPEDKPSWNLVTSSQRSFSRMFNQELNDQNQKRFKYDSELKKKSTEQPNHTSRMTHYDDQNQSQFGTELINDLRLPKIKSPHRKSTPDTFRMNSIQAPSVMNTTFDKESIIQERKITKRTKKPREKNNGNESRLSKQFEPQVDGFQLQGSTLKIEGDAKVRPLANMNYKNAEDKVKIRATSRLYSSLMTPRSYFSNDTSMNF